VQNPFFSDAFEFFLNGGNLPFYSLFVNIRFVHSYAHKSGLLSPFGKSYFFFGVFKFILQCCQLNLEISFGGCGSFGEDFKYELEAVEVFGMSLP
jgi:hypothetical protein